MFCLLYSFYDGSLAKLASGAQNRCFTSKKVGWHPAHFILIRGLERRWWAHPTFSESNQKSAFHLHVRSTETSSCNVKPSIFTIELPVISLVFHRDPARLSSFPHHCTAFLSLIWSALSSLLSHPRYFFSPVIILVFLIVIQASASLPQIQALQQAMFPCSAPFGSMKGGKCRKTDPSRRITASSPSRFTPCPDICSRLRRCTVWFEKFYCYNWEGVGCSYFLLLL